jgi:hypothetical protein
MGDEVGGDKIAVGDISGSTGVAIGRGAQATVTRTGLSGDEIARLFAAVYRRIEARPEDPDVDKEELTETVRKIQREAAKGEAANPNRVARWLKTLALMASDIFDVTVACLTSPVAGIAAYSGQVHAHGGDFVSRDKIVCGDEIHGDKVIHPGPTYPRLNYRGEVAHLIDFYTQTFGERDIQALLRGYGAAEETAAHLAPRVLAMTKGEPLFARFVCQEVADAGETALVRLEREPLADVEAYFRQQFRQLDKLAEGDHTWGILGLLVVALGGMTVEEIAESLGLGKRQARKAIEPIMRFLLGASRLELMHLQLRDD